MSEPKLTHQALQTLGFFQGVQVLALNVFDQRHGGGRLVGHVAHQHGHALQPRQAGGTETPLPGNDLVHRARTTRGGRQPLLGLQGSQAALALGVVQAPHQNGLHDALGLDAFGQLVQRAFVHARARLVGAGHQIRQRQGGRHIRRQAVQAGGVVQARAQQRFQAATESFGFFGDHV